MKKFLSIMACMVMVLVGGVALAACGNNKPKDVTATETSKVVTFAGLDSWKNSDDFGLEYLGNNKYKAKGSAASMTAEEGEKWGNVAEGSKYVILSIKMEKGSTMKTGWKSVETADVAFAEGEGSNKTYSGEEGVKEFILGISNGETALHAENPVWRVELKAPQTEGQTEVETVVYTIDFSALYA